MFNRTQRYSTQREAVTYSVNSGKRLRSFIPPSVLHRQFFCLSERRYVSLASIEDIEYFSLTVIKQSYCVSVLY